MTWLDMFLQYETGHSKSFCIFRGVNIAFNPMAHPSLRFVLESFCS